MDYHTDRVGRLIQHDTARIVSSGFGLGGLLIPTPHVLIDGYFLQKPYGFGRFIGELCRALGTAPGDMRFTVAVPDRIDPATLPSYARLVWQSAPDANFAIWEQVTIPRLARRLACDVVHFPYNTKALYTFGIPAVTTVHDLLFLRDPVSVRRPKDYLASRYSRLVFRIGSRRADAVVSVSRTTQRALREVGVQACTVYNTVDGFTSEFMPAHRPVSARRYILHRGGYLAHRNTGRVIDAFRLARPQIGDVALKIIGAPLGAERWNAQGDDGIQFLPRVSDQELAELYAGTACVVATSLEEGFGLPIIEGFGFGAPVITSNIDPMREIGADAALLVDPTSVPAIAEAMTSILCDGALAAALVSRGRDRMQVFSSGHVAEQMAAVYRGCLDRR